MNRLWTSDNVSPLKWRRVYYPSSFVEDGDPFDDRYWQDLPLRDLNEEERHEMHEEGLRCKKFLIDADKWEEERENHFIQQGCVYIHCAGLNALTLGTIFSLPVELAKSDDGPHAYTRDFQESFPVDDEHLIIEFLQKYVAIVEEMVNTTVKIFGQKTRTIHAE